MDLILSGPRSIIGVVRHLNDLLGVHQTVSPAVKGTTAWHASSELADGPVGEHLLLEFGETHVLHFQLAEFGTRQVTSCECLQPDNRHDALLSKLESGQCLL